MQQSEIQSIKQRYGIVGTAPQLDQAIDIAVQVASTDLSVLITGESGVGKENFPQIIHQHSYRKHNSYFAINCGAIPEGTIDSELFGHEKGAFTSATSDRKGYFEIANGGTIFLDEVGELPLSTQVKLLRVLEAGEYIRVGSSKVQKTNVRIIAATNVNLQKAIQNGQFREDLFYRLNAVPIYIPPLRERKSDILLLFRKFASDFSEKYNMPAIKLTENAQNLLMHYYWKGNIRQLKNVTEQISIIEQNREITTEVLQRYLPQEEAIYSPALLLNEQSNNNKKSFSSEREILYQVLFDMKKDMNDLKALVNILMQQKDVNIDIQQQPSNALVKIDSVLSQKIERETATTPNRIIQPLDNNIQDTEEYVEENLSLAETERNTIVKALEKHKGKRKAAAQDLQISERTLFRKIKEYGLD
ncbi:MAG: sigma-54-dependent Fis family transcriptional regulator [Paludibacteraceae bacterium]|nr:sigma-54-dependent Fis family transcriptional regulator [Paludibacteraceae bacterium]